ncbi:MAG: hypothetical protein H6930_06095 [Rhodoferax sp.]|nr:hypothetical protein [Rhodoferax sp.]
MRTTLDARISALEAATESGDRRIPVVMLTLAGGGEAQQYAIDCDGETWTQRTGETLDQLKERAMAGAALHSPRNGSPIPVRLLCAKSLESWPALVHSDATD